MFHLEATYKKKKLIPNEIVKIRKEDVPLIKEKIKKLVFDSNPLKGSALEEAINYTKNVGMIYLFLLIMVMLKYLTILLNKLLSHL